MVETLAELYNPTRILIFSPGEEAVFHITSAIIGLARHTSFDWHITAFDISHTHGYHAYGTQDGFLRIWHIDGYNRTLDVSGDEELPLFVENVAWSPDGKQIAYIVNRTDFGTGPNPAAEKLTGLWIYTPLDGSNVQLIRNQYFGEVEDSEDIRLLRYPIWSPDGTGLILTGSFWEWFDILWLDPIVQDLEGETLIDPFEDLWMDASWSLDGKSIYVSGRAFASTGGLYRVNRETLEVELLIDGDEEGLIVMYAQELPDGIALVAWDDSMLPILYLGNQTEEGFEYAPVGSGEPICDFPTFNSFEWDITGRFLLVSCHGEWRYLSLDGRVNIDLAPYLRQLIYDHELELYWDYDRWIKSFQLPDSVDEDN